MGIGINLSIAGPSSQSIKVNTVDLPGVRGALQASVGGSRSLPGNPLGVLGKVFIQSSGNNGMTPDKVVYVSEDIEPDTYRVNMVSLNYQGRIVSPNNPNSGRIPMFEKDQNGAIVPTRDANAALALQNALANAANAGGTTGASAARQGGMAGRERMAIVP